MNFIFAAVCLLSAITLIIKNPDALLAAFLSGGEKAVELSLTLIVIYAVWLGIFSLMEKSGITDLLARLLKKPIRFLFGETDEKSSKYISLNLSANLLGLGGIATPMGIKACAELEKNGNEFASCMLFVIAATSIQLLPTSVVSLRLSLGSFDASDIIIPSILTTAVSTTVGILLVKIFKKR